MYTNHDAAVLAGTVSMRDQKNMSEKESKLLDRIAESVAKLDEAAADMESAGNRVTTFFHREKAMHEMRNILKDGEKLEEVSANAYRQSERMTDYDRDREVSVSGKIDRLLAKLDDTLHTLENTDDADHTQGFNEQRKALHEVKQILHQAGKYEQYEEDELSQLDRLEETL